MVTGCARMVAAALANDDPEDESGRHAEDDGQKPPGRDDLGIKRDEARRIEQRVDARDFDEIEVVGQCQPGCQQ